MEPWNDSSILPPPIQTTPCDPIFDLPGLNHICQDMQKVLSRQSPLHQESAILSRFIYKYSLKFRCDIGFRSFKKVNTALKRYLTVKIWKDIDYFTSTLPDLDSDDLYLPTKQMLEYLLVRIQTFSKIMLRACICSKQAAVFYLDRIKRGEAYWMSLMPYALMCRIWSLTNILIDHSCRWYNTLYKFYPNLEYKGLPFLPKKYALPCNLSEWLDIKNIDEFGRFCWTENKETKVLAILKEIEDPEDGFDLFKYVRDVNKNDPGKESDNQNESDAKSLEKNSLTKLPETNLLNTPKIINEISSKHIKSEDFGAKIDRNSFKKQIKQEECVSITDRKTFNVKKADNNHPPAKEFESESYTKTVHSSNNITSSNMLKQFTETEESLRNKGSSESLTSHLSFMQWQALKNCLSDLCKGTSNKKIERRFQKLWKEKCLEYL